LQRLLSLDQRLAANIVARQEEIERERHSVLIVGAPVKRVEVGHAIVVEVDNLCIDYERREKPSRTLAQSKVQPSYQFA
jgi:hypothetical protein